MSVDRKNRMVSRRFVVNALGISGVGLAVAYASGVNPFESQPAPLSSPVTAESPTPLGCMRGMTGDLLCPVVTTPDTKATAAVAARPTLIQPLDNHARDTAERVAGTTEIIGLFPDSFGFSPDIKESGLAPYVFLNEPTQTRINYSISYLGRLHRLLTRKPEHRGPTLSSLAINSPQNFPIAFAKDATLFDVLEDFLKSQAFGTVSQDAKPIIGANFHLGTIGNPELRNGKWELKAQTQFNTKVIDEKAITEDHGMAYYQTTDLQLALKLLHEFSHLKQDQGLMDEITKDAQAMPNIGQDPHKMREAIVNRAAQHKARIAREINLDPQTFAPNEAQANTVSQLALEVLNRVNGANRIPGVEDDDPYPQREDSLLRSFRVQVLGNHALDKRWLVRHNW